MDKSEPSLAPEWLRSSGSSTGSSGSSHHFATSQSDGPSSALSKRNKSSKSVVKNDSFRSSLLDWNLSSSSRRSSSHNGSVKHEKNQYFRSFSGFSRSQRDNKRDKVSMDDNWDAEYSDPLRSIMAGRIEKDLLRRSQSMISRKQSEALQGKASLGLKGTGHSSHENTNGGVGSVHSVAKVVFERDFPSLGSEDRPATADTMRVSSPRLSRSMQSLSIGNSSLTGVEGWTSALAEVPVGAEGTNTVSSAGPKPATSSAPAASSTISGLNMAEALVQAPLKSHNANQLSVQNQKREELAVLQSMRLIPMTTSMPKNINASDKGKPRTPRYGDQVPASKNGHLLPSPATQLLRSANVKPDGAKIPLTGKLIVLKPGRENGVSSTVIDTSTSKGSVSGNFVNGQASAGTSSVSSSPLKNPGNPKFSASTKTSVTSLNPGSMADKKPSSAHAKSRSDFFNLMRKKSMSTSAANALSSPIVSSDMEKSDDYKETSVAPANPVNKSESETKCNGTIDNAAFIPDDEEAAFLRSLGWEENAGEDEGLTEEEINAFCQRYMKYKPASKLCRVLQLKNSGQDEPSQEACSGVPTSDFSTSKF